jgi:hypothetical protein
LGEAPDQKVNRDPSSFADAGVRWIGNRKTINWIEEKRGLPLASAIDWLDVGAFARAPRPAAAYARYVCGLNRG